MAQATPETLKRTPLHDVHTALGAKLVPFAGYEMPVQYPTGITAEHRAETRGRGARRHAPRPPLRSRRLYSGSATSTAEPDTMANDAPTQTLKRTPFHDIHAELGAKLVPFAGYEMPVQYPTGITAEHKVVRSACGVFDVSHMGEFMVTGPDAVAFVSYVTTNDVAALAVGQVHYSTILNERGTIEDDCLVYRFADHLMIVGRPATSPSVKW